MIHPSVLPYHRCDACIEDWPLMGQLISGVTGSGEAASKGIVVREARAAA